MVKIITFASGFIGMFCMSGVECGSWVRALHVRQTQMNVRCPRGTKATDYKDCKVEEFAQKGEFLRWDGLQERRSVFPVRSLKSSC